MCSMTTVSLVVPAVLNLYSSSMMKSGYDLFKSVTSNIVLAPFINRPSDNFQLDAVQSYRRDASWRFQHLFCQQQTRIRQSRGVCISFFCFFFFTLLLGVHALFEPFLHVDLLYTVILLQIL